ncbi:MAG: ABC transporter permease [Lachnospiraceae bacterium]|nr:ABC transporter permease [Lachnospiraceae bacterium]
MLKNNNQAIIKKISSRTLKSNKTRNIFVILAIVLTTFMFTTVFSIGASLINNIKTMMLREQGTKSTIFLNNPDNSQIEKAKKEKYLDGCGIKIQTGIAEDKNTGAKLLLDWYSKDEFDNNYTPAISDIKGTYPEQEDGIMLSKSALDALGIKTPQEDMEIKLEQNGKTLSFRLSGWFTDYCYTKGGFQAFVSENYIKKLGMSQEKNGTLCISSKAGKQQELLQNLQKYITLNNGQEWDVVFDMQEENDDTAIVTITGILLIGFIIVSSGYLLIYNVMYISITKDICFYGMLKTIGTSPSQIKKIVNLQAGRLSLLGIPTGIILGTITSFVTVPFAIKMTGTSRNNIMTSEISFSPFIYIGTILFAIFTVYVSCRKPSKYAGKVSPVEALKYNGSNTEKYKARKGTDGGKIYKMAYRNVFRGKKKACLVFASLFMGTMAFLSVNTFLGSLKLDNYIEYYFPNDFTIYTNNPEDAMLSAEDVMNDSNRLTRQIQSIDGIKNVHLNISTDAVFEFDEELFMPFIEDASSSEEEKKELINLYKNATDDESKYQSPVVSVSAEMIETYNKQARQKIDIERFEKGEICLLGFAWDKETSDFYLGKDITIIDRKTKKEKTFEIGSCPLLSENYGIDVGYYYQKTAAPEVVIVSDTAIYELTSIPDINTITADCDKNTESYVKSKIKEYTKTNASVLDVDIKSEIASDFKTSMSAMNIIGGGISLILILIGIINFINVMLTGVYTRLNEISVMESVGMTKKQVKKMLIFEGMYYGIITIALVLTIGNSIIYLIAKLASQIADYATFYYPYGLMFAIAAVIMAICTVVPIIVYRTISQASITERLKID